MRGPAIVEMPKRLERIPVYNARLRRETTTATIESVPDSRPAAPAPAMARPIISMEDEVAAPDITEPSSKMRKKVMKVHYRKSVLVLRY